MSSQKPISKATYRIFLTLIWLMALCNLFLLLVSFIAWPLFFVTIPCGLVTLALFKISLPAMKARVRVNNSAEFNKHGKHIAHPKKREDHPIDRKTLPPIQQSDAHVIGADIVTAQSNSSTVESLDQNFIAAARIADMAVIDVETTGLSTQNDEIIDIGVALVLEKKIIATYSHLVRPRRSLSTFITNLTGITDGDLSDQPYISEVLAPILDEIRVLPILGHNVSFDISMIDAAAARMGIPGLEPSYVVDTLDLSSEFFPLAASHTLEDLIERLGISTNQEHRALSDVIQDFQCYLSLQELTTPQVVTPSQAQHSLQRKQQKNKAFFRSSWIDANDGIHPRNTKPQYPQVNAEIGVDINGEEHHQPLLQKYGRNAWLWVSGRKGIIPKGKYEGYPTIFISLDGEEIGHITAYQMARHIQQIPGEQFTALAHIRASQSARNLQLRVQLPNEHQPIDLTPLIVEERKPLPSPRIRTVKKENQVRAQNSMGLVAEEPINRKPHKAVLASVCATTITGITMHQDKLNSYPDGAWVWTSLRVQKTILCVTLDGEFIAELTSIGMEIMQRIPQNGAIAKAHIIKDGERLGLDLYLPIRPA